MNFFTFKLLLFILISSKITFGAPLESAGDLYFSEDDVQILTIHNFKEKIENSSTAWIVEFYASWCGDCQRFAPSWKEFASDVFRWKDLIQVGVLACSNEINTPICSEYEILHYPTVRYFREDYKSSPDDLGIDIHKTEENAESHKHHLLDVIIKEINEGRGGMYPNLKPYNHSDLSDLLESVSDDIKFIFLVVEPPRTYIGAEVTLDLHKTPNIAVRYTFDNNTKLVNKLRIERYPAVVVLDRNYNSEVLSENLKNRKEVKEVIGKFLERKGIKIVQDSSSKKKTSARTNTKTTNVNRQLQERIKKMGDVVFQMDLETALRYSLKNEVATTKTIQDEKLTTLRAYLEIVKKYFPLGHSSSSFLEALINLTDNDTNSVEGWKIGEIVRRAEDSGIFSSPPRFLGCQGSSPKYRGYPCSLWKLFHYFTVNSDNEDNPTEVLDVMLGYIKHFFGCEACSWHFQQMAGKRNLTEVSSLDSSVMWLWAAHNEVNERLRGDVTEDPEFPKVQFPENHNCTRKEDGSWDEVKVLEYLKWMYGKYNVRYVGSDTKILFLGL